MTISNITEAGANNILRWAINNGADIKGDEPLQSLINDETFYFITLENVNFLELFRLTQLYREKIRVIEEKRADIPPRSEMVDKFQGEISEDPENNPEKKVPIYELAEYAAQNFINLAIQMQADSDIIRPETVRLFLPMISRRFNVQIPFSFIDLISMITAEEATQLFSNEYPNNLTAVLLEGEFSNFSNMLYLGLMRQTSILRYNQRYDKMVQMTKYGFLKNAASSRLWKHKMISFSKYDNIARGEIRCSMFQPDKISMGNNMKRMANINTPLKVDFVVQLPIQHMQELLNIFTREELPVSYESSMSAIIDAGIDFHDFITYGYDEESEDPAEQAKITEYNNSIQAYETRINEANQIALNTIPIAIQNPEQVDITSAFALLPSIYSAKAVFTINTEYADKYITNGNKVNPMFGEMFQDMLSICSGLQENIKGSK